MQTKITSKSNKKPSLNESNRVIRRQWCNTNEVHNKFSICWLIMMSVVFFFLIDQLIDCSDFSQKLSLFFLYSHQTKKRQPEVKTFLRPKMYAWR